MGFFNFSDISGIVSHAVSPVRALSAMLSIIHKDKDDSDPAPSDSVADPQCESENELEK